LSIHIAIDGNLVAPEEAKISVLDRGFLYGDSVYEVIRTYRRRPFALAEHLDRLRRSAGLLEIELPASLEALSSEVKAVLQAATEHDESYIRIIITRGAGPIALDPGLAVDPARVVIVTQLTPWPEELYRTGAGIYLVPAGRHSGGAVPAGAKSGNYLVNLMALGRARRRGGHEAVLLDAHNRVSEGASSNVFVRAGELLRTPPLTVGILEGITRRKVIELARELGFEIEEAELYPDDLFLANEVFLTSTLREVMPVTTVDDHPVGDGRPGEVAMELRRQYRALAEQTEA
jgi:branched-chain amino acid aminotransferase